MAVFPRYSRFSSPRIVKTANSEGLRQKIFDQATKNMLKFVSETFDNLFPSLKEECLDKRRKIYSRLFLSNEVPHRS